MGHQPTVPDALARSGEEVLGQLECLGVEMTGQQIVLEVHERIGIIGVPVQPAETGGD